MKKHWVVVYNGCVISTNEWGDSFVSRHSAEYAARSLAKENPGNKYLVFEALSSYVVDGLTEEQAT